MQKIYTEAKEPNTPSLQILKLDWNVKEELEWWVHELQRWNGRPVQPPVPYAIIETDAPLLGWSGSKGGVHRGAVVRREEPHKPHKDDGCSPGGQE